jgi:hypothetical protein
MRIPDDDVVPVDHRSARASRCRFTRIAPVAAAMKETEKSSAGKLTVVQHYRSGFGMRRWARGFRAEFVAGIGACE